MSRIRTLLTHGVFAVVGVYVVVTFAFAVIALTPDLQEGQFLLVAVFGLTSWGSVATAVTRQIPLLLLAEASLSFMDLTVVTTGSWGRTIRTGMSEFPRAWWVSTAPVVVLCVTVVAFSILGDALRDATDPQTSDR